MKKLINDVQDVLDEQLAGLAKAHPSLTLHQDPVYVTRADAPVAGKVALLSGGGSGHEPMHCGYIGQGMLSGACPGEIFTSPTPDKIFECAMQVDGGEGVLLIIKNYTGDILNFETATELLHDSGVKVTTVVIDDDVAVKDSLYTAGRRGVANTVLIEKLVGAAAERGDSLDACAELGRKLNNQGHSIGIALGACTVPAAGKPSFTLADNEMEFGADWCITEARELAGKEYTVDALVKEAMKDKIFYEQSGGGVTLSGGEVMASQHMDYVEEVCRKLHENGVSVFIDTSGYTDYENLKRILPYVDVFLYDIKVMDPEDHKKYIGVDNSLILENLKKLSDEGAGLYIRLPIIQQVNATDEHIESVIHFLKENNIHARQVNLLPYHDIGKGKYASLDMEYHDDEMSVPVSELMEHFKSMFEEQGFNKVNIGG